MLNSFMKLEPTSLVKWCATGTCAKTRQKCASVARVRGVQGVERTPSAAVGFCSRDLAHQDRPFPAFVLKETVLPVSCLKSGSFPINLAMSMARLLCAMREPVWWIQSEPACAFGIRGSVWFPVSSDRSPPNRQVPPTPQRKLPHVQRSHVPRSGQVTAGRVGPLRMYVVCCVL